MPATVNGIQVVDGTRHVRHLVLPCVVVVAPRVMHGEDRAIGGCLDVLVPVGRAVVGGGALPAVQGVEGVGAS